MMYIENILTDCYIFVFHDKVTKIRVYFNKEAQIVHENHTVVAPHKLSAIGNIDDDDDDDHLRPSSLSSDGLQKKFSTLGS